MNKNNAMDLTPLKRDESVTNQVYHYLKERLVEEQYPTGHKLPSENVLAESLNVSRVSLRNALQRLELEGYIERKRGVGTFVIDRHPSHVEAGIEKMISMSELIRSRGHEPGTKEVEIFADTADKNIAKKLGLDEGSPVTVVNRVRTVDGKPLFWDSNIFPSKFLPPTTSQKIVGESLFSFVQDKLGVEISHAVARLLPAQTDEFLSKKLEVPIGTLLIKLDQVHYLEDNSPVWYSNLLYLDSSFSWYIVRTK
jgi:GntR family transcriptional regulator